MSYLLLLLLSSPSFSAVVADPPLVAAVKEHDPSHLKALIAAGEGLEAKDQYGWTALMWAVGHCDAGTVQALLDAGAALPEDAPSFSAVIEAAKGARADVLPILAAKGLDCSAKDETGTPALSFAVAHVSTATLKALLACKAKIDAKDAHGFTPLMRAVQLGQISAVKFLISKGAKVNVVDAQGRSALMLAAQDGRVEEAKALLAAKADPSLAGLDGRTAAQIAAARGHSDVSALLPAP